MKVHIILALSFVLNEIYTQTSTSGNVSKCRSAKVKTQTDCHSVSDSSMYCCLQIYKTEMEDKESCIAIPKNNLFLEIVSNISNPSWKIKCPDNSILSRAPTDDSSICNGINLTSDNSTDWKNLCSAKSTITQKCCLQSVRNLENENNRCVLITHYNSYKSALEILYPDWSLECFAKNISIKILLLAILVSFFIFTKI